MSSDELAATINLLDFSVSAFEIMARAAQENKDDAANLHHLQVRIAFAKVLAAKLINYLEMGDTKNRTFH
jgi:hypothetical protein